jgi:hypothetical protein
VYPGGERVSLLLQAKPSDRPLGVRMRLVLKDLLRREDLRCLAIVWDPAPPPGCPTDPTGDAGAAAGPSEQEIDAGRGSCTAEGPWP